MWVNYELWMGRGREIFNVNLKVIWSFKPKSWRLFEALNPNLEGYLKPSPLNNPYLPFSCVSIGPSNPFTLLNLSTSHNHFPSLNFFFSFCHFYLDASSSAQQSFPHKGNFKNIVQFHTKYKHIFTDV